MMMLALSSQAQTNLQKKSCANAEQTMQDLYAKEFGLSKKEAVEVFLTYRNFQNVQIVKAVHSKFCSPRGCASSLFYTAPDVCPKVVLNYTGKIRYTGPESARYESLRISERVTAVDDGPFVKRTYKFDRAQLTYVEVKI